MKRLSLLLTFLVFAASLSAQPLRVEHNLQFGLGTYVYGGDYYTLFQSGHRHLHALRFFATRVF